MEHTELLPACPTLGSVYLGLDENTILVWAADAEGTVHNVWLPFIPVREGVPCRN